MHYQDVGEWKKDIKERYGGGHCGEVIGNSLGMVFNNWHRVRVEKLKEVKERFSAGAMVNIDVVDRTVREIKERIQGNVLVLKGLVNNISDPDTGMLVGTNCKVIGENVVAARDALCFKTFNSVYSLLMVFTIISFLALFSLCFITCSAIRQESLDGPKKGDAGDGCGCCNKGP